MRKSAKLALVLLVLAIGGLIAFAGARPEGYRTVSDLASDPSQWEGREVEIKAAIAAGSLARDATPPRFEVEDDRARLAVEWRGAQGLPEHETGGTLEGRIVVLKGAMALGEDGAWVFRATDVQVGCASKYEPAAPVEAAG